LHAVALEGLIRRRGGPDLKNVASADEFRGASNSVPDAGEPGNRNAWKHGRFTAEAIALRREVADLLRAARDLLNDDM